jgi:mycothiol synthase
VNGNSISVVRTLSDPDRAAVLALVARAAEADGVTPLSEHVRLRVKHGGEADVWHFVARRLAPEGSQVVGYAHLDKTHPDKGPVAELAVDPAHRRHGVGGALADALRMKVSARRGDKALMVWAHGALPGSERLAESRGLTAFRELWVMARPMHGADSALPAIPPAAGIEIRAFRPGVDDEAWVALNAKAFAHHREQGSMTVEDLRQRMAEPWFDPDGFFLAWRGDHLAGFHWTKMQSATQGEVYVVGVDPAEQGGGLGKVLTVVGLEYLRDRGVDEVILYVDGDNAAAVAVYTRLGFVRRSLDVMYRAAA